MKRPIPEKSFASEIFSRAWNLTDPEYVETVRAELNPEREDEGPFWCALGWKSVVLRSGAQSFVESGGGCDGADGRVFHLASFCKEDATIPCVPQMRELALEIIQEAPASENKTGFVCALAAWMEYFEKPDAIAWSNANLKTLPEYRPWPKDQKIGIYSATTPRGGIIGGCESIEYRFGPGSSRKGVFAVGVETVDLALRGVPEAQEMTGMR